MQRPPKLSSTFHKTIPGWIDLSHWWWACLPHQPRVRFICGYGTNSCGDVQWGQPNVPTHRVCFQINTNIKTCHFLCVPIISFDSQICVPSVVVAYFPSVNLPVQKYFGVLFSHFLLSSRRLWNFFWSPCFRKGERVEDDHNLCVCVCVWVCLRLARKWKARRKKQVWKEKPKKAKWKARD